VKKGSKLYSVIRNQCPKCQNEAIYKSKNPYALGSFMNMNDKCSNCGFKYELETGFFYGAMYVNYAIAIAISVAVFVLTRVWNELDVTTYLIVNGITLLVLSPVIYRLGRIIWLNIFVKYDP